MQNTIENSNKIKGKLLVSLLTKNCKQYIPYVLKNVEKYASLFESYYCLIVDGYSTDSTELICKSWCKTDHTNRLFLHQPSKQLPRNESLNEARNFVISTLKPQFGEDVYLLLLDADSPNAVEPDLKGFLKAFNTDIDWTALFCNQKNDKYYDILALRDVTLVENYQMKYRYLSWSDGSMQNALKKYEKTKADPSGFYPVESAFSGAGLYKTNRIEIANAKYKCTAQWKNPDNNRIIEVFECEHVPFHQDLIKQNYKLYINCDWYIGPHN